MNTALRATMVAAAISLSIPVGVGIAFQDSLPRVRETSAPLNSRHLTSDTGASAPVDYAIGLTHQKYALYPKSHLCSMLVGIAALEKHGRARLSRAQAQSVFLTLQSWQTKPTMSYTEAQEIDLQITQLLTRRQQQEIEKLARGASLDSQKLSHDAITRIANKSGVAVRFIDIGVPSDPAQIDALGEWITRISSFAVTVNPLYPPEAYHELTELPLIKQQKMQTDYRNCRIALAQIERKARLHKRKAI